MVIEKGDADAMYNLGYYYESRKKYNKMKKYYRMAIEKGDADAMIALGNYYKDVKKDYELMVKYYIMALQNGAIPLEWVEKNEE